MNDIVAWAIFHDGELCDADFETREEAEQGLELYISSAYILPLTIHPDYLEDNP